MIHPFPIFLLDPYRRILFFLLFFRFALRRLRLNAGADDRRRTRVGVGQIILDHLIADLVVRRQAAAAAFLVGAESDNEITAMHIDHIKVYFTVDGTNRYREVYGLAYEYKGAWYMYELQNSDAEFGKK